MAIEVLCAGSVKDISTFVVDCQFSPEAFVLLEMLPQRVIDKSERQDLLHFARFDDAIDIARYSSGRIFHKDFELRWKRSDDNIQMVYLGVERSLPRMQDVRWLDLKPYTSQLKSYYLFGKRLRSKQLAEIGSPAVEGDFAEVRIPRLLRYPAPEQARRVRLVIQEYVHKQTDELVVFRFQDLVAAKEDT
jgi:hypothetical protein